MILLCCVELELCGLCTQDYLVGWCEPRWLARKGPPYWGAKSELLLVRRTAQWWGWKLYRVIKFKN